MAWRSMDSLQQLLTCSGQLGSTLYYRQLDMPLAEWESMKTVKVLHDSWRLRSRSPCQIGHPRRQARKWGRWFHTALL